MRPSSIRDDWDRRGGAGRGRAVALGLGLLVGCVLCSPLARAQPIDYLASWEGTIDYFATGAPLAVAGSDPNDVDVLSQPASITVSNSDIPATADQVATYLYWAGTIPDQADCANAPVSIDDEVVLWVPGAAVGVPVTADECFCSPGATSYDIQACRVDVTAMVATSGMNGTFTVDEFAADVAGAGATDNASFSIVLIYEEPDLLPPRRVALYDGLEEFYLSSHTVSLTGLDIDTPASGDLTWYVLDGDVGGSGTEYVEVQGLPGGLVTNPFDAYNPTTNPMNRTINTTQPVQTGVLGVDIDRLDVSAGLTPGDSSVDMTYSAGSDKFWVVYNLVGVNVFRAVIHPRLSAKGWQLWGDADSSGNVTPGDTIRYTIHLYNIGTAPGVVSLTDAIPAEAASWNLVDGAGGTDLSTATTLVLNDIFINAQTAVDVVFDVVLAAGTAGLTMHNTAHYDSGPTGTVGDLVAPPAPIYGGPQQDAGVGDDAGETTPDAAVSPDSAAPGPDSAVTADAAGPTPDGGGTGNAPDTGCGCRSAARGAGAPWWVLLLLALWWDVRRRRR
ncbi:MAG: MYXO-CTERM sorting domain-containing protein [bacterium]